MLIQHLEMHRDGGLAGEESIHFAAKTQILGTLANIEDQLRLATASIPGINLNQPVLHGKPPQFRLQRSGLHQRHIQPSVRNRLGRRSMQPGCLGTAYPEGRGGPCLVVDLHQKGHPTRFMEDRRCRTRRGLDPHLWRDLHDHQHMGIQYLLGTGAGLVGVFIHEGRLEVGTFLRVERRPRQSQRLGHATHLGGKGLPIGHRQHGQLSGIGGGSREGQ